MEKTASLKLGFLEEENVLLKKKYEESKIENQNLIKRYSQLDQQLESVDGDYDLMSYNYKSQEISNFNDVSNKEIDLKLDIVSLNNEIEKKSE